MSPTRPVVSGPDLVAALERAGFERRGQRGSHVKLRHPGSGHTVIVPLHDELARGTLASICRQAGWSTPELRRALRPRRRQSHPEPPGLER
ncbi:MAG: type II toxin-antitoxin system HicA family toxin [Candidatus Dormibacteraeota bacterium]|nr:type II toxin-antitoxin system HicA family toxin [Candidatus Dormibacteraeota bacterium]